MSRGSPWPFCPKSLDFPTAPQFHIGRLSTAPRPCTAMRSGPNGSMIRWPGLEWPLTRLTGAQPSWPSDTVWPIRKVEKDRENVRKRCERKMNKKMQEFRFSAGFRLWWRLFLNNLPQTHCKGTGGETLRPSQNADCQNWRATKRTVPKSSSAAATDRYLARAAQDPTSHNFRNAMSFIPSIPKAKETWKQFAPVVLWYIVMFFSLLVRWYICCWTMSHPFSFFFLSLRMSLQKRTLRPGLVLWYVCDLEHPRSIGSKST